MMHSRATRRCWSGCWRWMTWTLCTPQLPAWSDAGAALQLERWRCVTSTACARRSRRPGVMLIAAVCGGVCSAFPVLCLPASPSPLSLTLPTPERTTDSLCRRDPSSLLLCPFLSAPKAAARACLPAPASCLFAPGLPSLSSLPLPPSLLPPLRFPPIGPLLSPQFYAFRPVTADPWSFVQAGRRAAASSQLWYHSASLMRLLLPSQLHLCVARHTQLLLQQQCFLAARVRSRLLLLLLLVLLLCCCRVGSRHFLHAGDAPPLWRVDHGRPKVGLLGQVVALHRMRIIEIK